MEMLDIKTTVNEVKNAFNELINAVDMANKTISKLEHRLSET